jgi:hypothetical protein
LEQADLEHLSSSRVTAATPLEPRFGMCGHLNPYAFPSP